MLAVLAITSVAAFLRLVDLDRAGLGNLFYASAIRSMGESWHNFLYAAYDPAGTINVDKPPVALWVQVASTKIFGFSGVAIIAPIAIAGTLAVPLVFGGARRSHGVAAGLLAAAVLAVFPESVGTARDSTMDAMLMMGLAAGGWLLVAAVESRRPWRIVAWAALMGVLFNVKFFEGFLVMPAALLYIGWSFRDDWRVLVRPLAASALVGAVVAFSWIAVVDLTPHDSRPIVMNDESNSELGLALRYNGLERVLPGEIIAFTPLPGEERSSSTNLAFGVGHRGVRLIWGDNGALIGFGASLALGGLGLVLFRRRDWLINGPGLFWGAWLLTGVAFFSVSNRAAAHYNEAYAPALAVMAGVGLVEVWRARGRVTSLRQDWSRLLAPAMIGLLLVYGVAAYYILPRLRPEAYAIIAIGLLAAGALALAMLRSLPERLERAITAVAIAAPIAVMFVTSLWIALESPPSGQITRPNPVAFAGNRAPPDAAPSVPVDAILEHGNGVLPDARYRFAITDVNDAGEAIAYSGASVLPVWNGYQRVPVLEDQELVSLIRGGDIPYLLIEERIARTGLLDGIQAVATAECAPVEIEELGDRWTAWNCAPDAAVSR